MTPFTEVLLVFGTTRDKEKFEGLDDEKTKHYQIVFTNYDFTKQACHRRDKKQMRVYGSSLQDMAADAFKGIAIEV
ncbi:MULTISPECIES: hypothetical protein [unclassified Campylobacter]|uniref:hypothetical protein n=1 Tax=unclassified Campylobacter TaxID=2593542 RepID=UPI003D343BC9